MSDAKDRILDACLEEILGGHTPPDLSARIMQAYSGNAPRDTTADSNIEVAIYDTSASRSAVTLARTLVSA